jgi:ribosomal protein L37AE/L43A
MREIVMTTMLSNPRSKFGMICVQCSNELIAPECSVYQNKRQIRHVWHCPTCSACFESLISFAGVSKSTKDILMGDDIFPSLFPALLVA